MHEAAEHLKKAQQLLNEALQEESGLKNLKIKHAIIELEKALSELENVKFYPSALFIERIYRAKTAIREALFWLEGRR